MNERVAEAKWARIISDVFSPPVVWAIMTFPIALRDAETHSRGLMWAAIYVTLVCILPVAYILWLVSTNQITDMHMPRRQERTRPFIVTLMGALIALIIFKIIKTSETMDFYALSTLMQISLLALITLVWQISIHTMSISGVVVTIGIWFNVLLAILLIPLVLVVAGARLKLRRHTIPQVAAGIVVGTVSVAMLMVLLEGL